VIAPAPTRESRVLKTGSPFTGHVGSNPTLSAGIERVRAQAWSDTTFKSQGASGRKKREGAAQITGITCSALLGKYRARKCEAPIQAVARRLARSYKQYQAQKYSESGLTE
jgi:hypothetical protein